MKELLSVENLLVLTALLYAVCFIIAFWGALNGLMQPRTTTIKLIIRAAHAHKHGAGLIIWGLSLLWPLYFALAFLCELAFGVHQLFHELKHHQRRSPVAS